MSNVIDKQDEGTEAMTEELRTDNFTHAHSQAKPFVKAPIIADGVKLDNLSPEDIIKLSNIAKEHVREAIAEAAFNARVDYQVIAKEKVPITDFSRVTLDQVYDLNFPIEAKPFMSADMLLIELKDTNYEARWVNKNPQRIGEMIGKGFTYICEADLVNSEGIKASLDAQGHFSMHDVVAMKIDKATYYRALRFAQERAVKTTNSTLSGKSAAVQANAFMNKSEFKNDYSAAAGEGKMKFYNPDIEI